MPVTTINQPTPSHETVAQPQAPTLDQTLSAIAVDSKTAPENYLRETEVPHGGE
jgi:hypothetical protein